MLNAITVAAPGAGLQTQVNKLKTCFPGRVEQISTPLSLRERIGQRWPLVEK
jgi:hypothetical protein